MRAGDQSGHRKPFRRAALLLALVLLLSACLPAGAEEGGARTDIEMMLAQMAVSAMDLKDADGNPLVPRKEPETTGRGLASKNEPEPDYRGVVGYMSLQTDWEVTRFSTFNQTPWRLPVYEEDGDGWKQCGMISHKTPVLVIDQKIAVGKAYNYYGYLKVVRLDTDEVVWINVTQFVTVPYWTLELREAIQYGYVIAVYRNQSKSEPTDRKKHRGPLPEGVRVLVGDNVTARYRSWDREHNPILGIVFRSNTETDSCYRTFLFFNPDDLIMIY